MRSQVVVLALVAVAVGPVAGQRLATAYPRWEPILQSSTPAPKAPAPDYRWEGLTVGAAFVGLLGAALGGGFCGYDDSATKPNCTWPTIEGFLVGAVVGGVTGGLLGSLIKKPPPDSADHP